ncbi:MAG: chorismate mutase [Lachnospiraceae bacterium]|nr:chorismate mutase [Lachnospiraceae bacterium]
MRNLNELRPEIDAIDQEMQALFERRMAIAGEVAAYKKANGLPVLDEGREEALLEKLRDRASDPEMGEAIVRLYEALLAVSRDYQTRRIDHD